MYQTENMKNEKNGSLNNRITQLKENNNKRNEQTK